MIAIVGKSEIKGQLTPPPSKSYAHRMLIAAALSGGKTVIKNLPDNSDVDATVRGLIALGAKITIKGDVAEVEAISGDIKSAEIDCGESGSTLRFLLPVAAVLGIKTRFTGHGRLPERPVKELVDTLRAHGAAVSGYKLPLTVSGAIKSGNYVIDGSVSSQYITGLLLALSFTDGESAVIIEGEAVSKPYIDITVEVLKAFNAVPVIKGNKFIINSGKGGRAGVLTVPADYSGAAFFAVMGAISGDVTIKGLKDKDPQGDAEIFNFLKAMGAEVKTEKGAIRVIKSKLNAIEAYCKDCPDIVPVLSVAAAFANGITVLSGVKRLKDKESDRIKAIIDLLARFGIRANFDGDALYIEGGNPIGSEAEGFGDHRIVMSAGVAATAAEGKTLINGAEAVGKSYPAFFGEINKLGGRAYVSTDD